MGKKSIFVIFLSVAILHYGCTRTKIVKIDNVELQGGSLLKRIDPLVFEVKEFKDEIKTQNFLGMFGEYRVASKKNISEIVTKAIILELKRNGHIVVEGKSNHASVIMGGSIESFNFRHRADFFYHNFKSNVDVSIKMSSPLFPKKTFNKTYKGYYEDKTMADSWRLLKVVVNEALLGMVRDFTADQELLEFLRKIREAGGSEKK
jgi:hypothetical protein